jgi:hypothetical protein
VSDMKERLRAWRKRMPANWYGNRDLEAAAARIEQLESQLKAASEALDQFRAVCLVWKDCEGITGSIDLEPIRAAFDVIDLATTGAKTP